VSGDKAVSPRQRVQTALRHRQPDRVPVDFLATTEVWDSLTKRLEPDLEGGGGAWKYFDPRWEAVLRHLEVDCRVLSYDQFYAPPETVLLPGAAVEWWDVPSRSAPNRMWRQRLPGGIAYDCWRRRMRLSRNPVGAYEEFTDPPLGAATSVADVGNHPWPEPDWWNFSPMRDIVRQLDSYQEYHIRFRIGSVFEVAWQLRGLEQFLTDLAIQPRIPLAIMDRLTDICVENTRRVLEIMGDRLDMVYFYDDVATQASLMISPKMWREFIRPRHARLIEAARSQGVTVMYHCDGAIRPLIPELLDLGVQVLNPIQADAEGMSPEGLKKEFGDRLCFHGGIDIVRTLPRGTVEDVRKEVCDRVRVLGRDGGYILASSHHIQADTPMDNILAMYDLSLRQPPGYPI
jgi:uroporphyrinogen decarboxylase